MGGINSSCGRVFPAARLRPVGSLTPGVRAELDRTHPDLDPEAPVCRADVARFRRLHLEALLERERGTLSSLDTDVPWTAA